MDSASASSSGLSYIRSLKESIIRPGLDRIADLLRHLEAPQNNFPAIHIAGTNGKGSVAAMLESILSRGEFRVGMYTSPHIAHLTERFRVDQTNISTSNLNDLSNKIQSVASRIPLRDGNITQFEFLTALAFEYFSSKKVDVAIVETGLGGRLDATNVLSNVWLSIITNVDMDHMNWLGSTPSDIAEEKAGIIKKGVPVVTGATDPALGVIREKAKQLNAPLSVVLNKDGESLRDVLAKRKLKGSHQLFNAAIVVQAMDLLKTKFPKISKENIYSGIIHSVWPGRFEEFKYNNEKCSRFVVFDGAHNVPAVKALLETLKEKGYFPFDLLFGVVRDKDIKGMISLLAPNVRECAVVPIESERGANPHEVAEMSEWNGKARAFSSRNQGWNWIREKTGTVPLVVTGSMYLLGSIRSKGRDTLIPIV